MKIKVTTYRVGKKRKSDFRLYIGFNIETANEGTYISSVQIQLHPIAYFHGKIPEEAFGLLCLSAIVYAIDRSVSRHRYSVDGWSRVFDVNIKIPAHEKFRQQQSEINAMLSFLTGDYWNCQFEDSVEIDYPKYNRCEYFDDITQVNLFSGGLDSLIGAIDYMTNNPDGRLFLSSHYDGYMKGPKSDQEKVKNALIHKFPGNIRGTGAVMITPKHSNEMSCRSRSLMFLSLATIVASYANCNIGVPENGSISINFPLSPSRRAACSTRTTHPIFLKNFESLSQNLGLSPHIYNPYEFFTKGEMVANCADQDILLEILPKSNSCGKRNMHQLMFDYKDASHCAHCMPCMYRKASLVGVQDKTTYGNKLETVFAHKEDAMSNDFFAMLDFLKRELSRIDIKKELLIGGMTGLENIEQYVDLVQRTRNELISMLKAENSILINNYMGWI